MSYWESVPFDILTSIVPYLTYHPHDHGSYLGNITMISKFCLDPFVMRRLGFNDPNGFIWKFLFTQHLSQNLPTNHMTSLRDLYLEYLNEVNDYMYMKELFKWPARRGYEILCRNVFEENQGYERIGSETALLTASKHGHLNIVEYLIKEHNNIDEEGDRALLEASENDHIDIAKCLIKAGAITCPKDICDALVKASTKGHFFIVKYLVKQLSILYPGRKLSVCNRVLRRTLQYGHLDIMKYLISQGVKIDDAHIDCALAKGHIDCALAKGRLDIAQFLMEMIL